MNTFRRQQFRGFVVTILTAALLATAVAFTIIGYAAGEGNQQQIEAIDARYLTVGFLKEQDNQPMINPGWYPADQYSAYPVWQEKNYSRLADGSIQWKDGSIFYSSGKLEQFSAEAPQTQRIHRSAILSAHVKDTYGLSSAMLNENNYNAAFDNNGVNFCVVLLQIEPFPQFLIDFGFKFDVPVREQIREEGVPRQFLRTLTDRRVKELVSAHPYYQRRIEMGVGAHFDQARMTTLQDAEGAVALGEEKRYLFRCFYSDSPILIGRGVSYDGTEVYERFRYENTGELAAKLGGANYLNILGRSLSPYYPPTTASVNEHENVADALGSGPENFVLEFGEKDHPLVAAKYVPVYFYTTPEDSLPFFTEVTTDTVEEFLQTEEGVVWRDVIIPMAEINQQSATVVLTDNVDYISGFSSGEAYVLDGREIEPVEYESGSKVCLISAFYARANDLSVGDTLTLDYYDTGYFLHTGEEEMIARTVHEMNMTHNPLQESNRIGYEADYEIVGIYTAPEWEFGVQTFHADTIFVPKASVPNAEEYEDPALPLLNSVVIQNGSEDEFEAYMQEQGYGGYYEFYDHDYSSNIAGFEAMTINAQRLLILGMIVLTVTCVMFYYLNFRRMIPVARNMRRLGHSGFGVWLKILTTMLPVVIIAVLGGRSLGVYSFDYITVELLSAESFLNLNTVKQVTLTAGVALCIPPVLIAIPVSLPNLMKRK